jgi:hypothetical protein
VKTSATSRSPVRRCASAARPTSSRLTTPSTARLVKLPGRAVHRTRRERRGQRRRGSMARHPGPGRESRSAGIGWSPSGRADGPGRHRVAEGRLASLEFGLSRASAAPFGRARPVQHAAI